MKPKKDAVAPKARFYLAGAHLNNADFYARGAEKADASPPLTIELLTAICAYSMASVFSSVAFLEASINEVFADAVEEPNPSRYELRNWLTEENRNRLADRWNLLIRNDKPIRRLSTLEKYVLALQLAEKPAIDAGCQPYQDVHCLIELRNVLIHAMPEWLEVTPSGTLEEHDLETKLKPRFEPCKLVPETDPYFPNRCLGAGCARWAHESVIAFANDFNARLGLQLRWQGIQDRAH